MCQNVNDVEVNIGFCCFSTVMVALPCFLISPGYIIRREAKLKYGIKEDFWRDLALGYFCNPCIMCQVANEVRHHRGKSPRSFGDVYHSCMQSCKGHTKKCASCGKH
jgi:hypothetical protein